MAEPPAAPPGSPKKGFFVNVGSLVSSRAFTAASQILVLPIIARQLSVDEFALMAMAMTVVVFTQTLSDAGLGRSLIRSPGMDIDEWSSVFWLLVGVGVGLAALIAVAAPFVAAFYDQPLLTWMLLVLALVPLCQAISAVYNAALERHEDYVAISRVQILATALGLAVVIGLALTGAGVWALVFQQLTLAAVRAMGIIYLSSFRPRAVISRHLLRPHLRFARHALTASAIHAVQNQAAVVAVARMLGTAPLGIFAMSERFTRLPMFGLSGPFSTVVYVRMAKAQDNPVRLAEIYQSAVRLLAVALCPPVAMLSVSGHAVFSVMLSERWAPVAPIFAYSIIGITIEAIVVVCLACLFRAVNKTDLVVRLASESAILRVGLTVGGAMISLQAVAIALTLWGIAISVRGWMLSRRVVDLGLRRWLGALLGPMATGALFAILYVLFIRGRGLSLMSEMWIAIGLTLLAYGATFLLERHKIRAAVGCFQAPNAPAA